MIITFHQWLEVKKLDNPLDRTNLGPEDRPIRKRKYVDPQDRTGGYDDSYDDRPPVRKIRKKSPDNPLDRTNFDQD